MSRKILVVEDHADTRELLTSLLELENFRVVTAPDGAAALKAAELEDPDLVVTDISLPDLDGIEVIRMLRGNTRFAGIPIVTVTANGPAVADQALSAGADAALTKPLEFDQLISSIRRLICRDLSLATFGD